MKKKIYESITATCKDCGQEYVITPEEQKHFRTIGYELPKRCAECRRIRRAVRKATEAEEKSRQAAIAKEKAQKKWEEDERKLAALLKAMPYKQTEISKLTSDENTLFIIGNGFDIMHGVKSSYWNFQETLGKNSEIRFYLETYLDVEDLWWNFEDSLSHLNAGMMLDCVDMWLENFDVYGEDDSASAYYGAIDSAMLPIEVLGNDLPKRFRKWVETLESDGTTPMKKLISKKAIYLNFNYTEFLELLYDVPYENIKYIHGCRKKIKYQPKEKLILGHVPNVDYLEDYRPSRGLVPRYKNKWKRAMLDSAMDLAVQNWIPFYEEVFTKHTPDIIKDNQKFFDATEKVKKIVTIGHSLSKVDYPYFEEIVSKNHGKANWYLGYHSYDDMIRVLEFVKRVRLPQDRVTVFRT